MQAQWDESVRRILLGDILGGVAVLLQPIRFRCAEVWTSNLDCLNYMQRLDLTHIPTRLAPDLPKRDYCLSRTVPSEVQQSAWIATYNSSFISLVYLTFTLQMGFNSVAYRFTTLSAAQATDLHSPTTGSMNCKVYGWRRPLHNLKHWGACSQPSSKMSVPTYELWTCLIWNRSATYLQNMCLLYTSLLTNCNPRWAGWRSQNSD
jgi:hypothetical protein